MEKILPVAVLAAVIVLLLSSIPFFYVKVPPSKVAVFTGRGSAPKIVRGGARLRVPGFERVDYMSLEPLNIHVKLRGAASGDGVRLNLEAVGMVCVGSDDEAVQTAVHRFLTTDTQALRAHINEILAGSLSETLARTTIEELNADRDRFARSILEKAGDDLRPLGLQVDVIKVTEVSDDDSYLESLGQRRIAQVKRDAAIGTAEAESDTQIRSAQARQAGAVAQAEADIAIAQAIERRNVEIAQLRAQTEAENARADQAGLLARTEAEKDVLVARERTEAARLEASIEIQQLQAEHANGVLQANVIAPAEAEQQATVKLAEGHRQATVLHAQAQAQATRDVGEAVADSRKAAAAAMLVERQAEASGFLALLLAEVEGLKAKLEVEATGKKEVGEALNSYSEVAARITTLPDVLAALVAATEAAAKPVSALENVTLIGGSGDAQASIATFLELSPKAVAKTLEVLKASGIDLAGWLAKPPADSAPEGPVPAFGLDLGLN